MSTCMERIKAVLFVILILALGLASTSTGLLAQIRKKWYYDEGNYYDDWDYCPLCDLGLAGSIIGTTGLAFATVIELIGYASGRSTT